MDGYIFIKLTNKCNTLCNFCADDQNVRNKPDPNIDDIKKQLIIGYQQGFRKVIFSGGEPTISPFFLDILKFSKETLKFELIHLTTNARALSNEEYFKKVEKYIDRFQVSFFSANPFTFDRIANANNAFFQVVKALQLMLKYNKNVISNVVITKDNYTELDQILILLFSLNINYIQFAFPNPVGFALKNNVFVKYSEIQTQIIKLIEINQKKLKNITIGFENFPLCIFYKINPNFIDFISDLSHPLENKNYYMSSKRYSEKCKNCKFLNKCEGLFIKYFDLFGDSEINPIN